MKVRRALLAVGVLLAAASIGMRPTSAASTFSASAGGEVVRVVVKMSPPLLQEELLDPGAVTAQASLTSFGDSTAFAAHPYPGSLPVAAPGLVDGLLGMTEGVPDVLRDNVNLPDYPFIASSSHPSTPTTEVRVGPVVLRASSLARQSTGIATDGADRTEASIVAGDDDVVTATATAEVGTVDLGTLVSLGGIRSSASVRQTASGELERSTEFSVASFSILGQHLRLTADGFELAGLNLSGGLGSSLDPVESLLSSLESQGVTLRFLEAEETPEGVLSAGLEVARSFDTGINGAVATITMTFGRTYANVSNNARPIPGGGGLSPSLPSQPTPSAGSNASLGDGAPPAGAAGPVPAPTTGGAAAPAVALSNPGEQLVRSLVPDTTDAARFYPVLALGAAVLGAAFTLFRKIGARSTWT